jgi:hypothetical protein
MLLVLEQFKSIPVAPPFHMGEERTLQPLFSRYASVKVNFDACIIPPSFFKGGLTLHTTIGTLMEDACTNPAPIDIDEYVNPYDTGFNTSRAALHDMP